MSLSKERMETMKKLSEYPQNNYDDEVCLPLTVAFAVDAVIEAAMPIARAARDKRAKGFGITNLDAALADALAAYEAAKEESNEANGV